MGGIAEAICPSDISYKEQTHRGSGSGLKVASTHRYLEELA